MSDAVEQLIERVFVEGYRQEFWIGRG